ncbi:MAG: GTPase Era [Treponema sp.]|nr:GTPase Era [Treponema sp.]MBQ2553224.1 GTPase Era [Treponema sp.]MBQ4235967.1 GTPase Era [Treponema sp.]
MNNEESSTVNKKSGVVSIIGRPSAGKSTFLNTASGEKISIVSSIPQTTRNAIRGIVNIPDGQLVFIDTPGLHKSEKKMNLKLSKIASDQIEDSDAILYIIDSTRECGDEEEMIAALARPYAEKLVIAVNKIDDVHSQREGVRDFISKWFKDFPEKRIFEISAKGNQNVSDVLNALCELSPEGPLLYPEEYYTDQEVEFRISEIIREQAINRLEQEIPHALYVSIEDMRMAGENRLDVRAVIYVERESQKGIVIGKGASMIKEIRKESMKVCRDIFPYWVSLDLQVKVDKNWRQKDKVLDKILK